MRWVTKTFILLGGTPSSRTAFVTSMKFTTLETHTLVSAVLVTLFCCRKFNKINSIWGDAVLYYFCVRLGKLISICMIFFSKKIFLYENNVKFSKIVHCFQAHFIAKKSHTNWNQPPPVWHNYFPTFTYTSCPCVSWRHLLSSLRWRLIKTEWDIFHTTSSCRGMNANTSAYI